uniref:Integrase catalytic domain-containing protein n=1 Tax=Nelumbo nucifera TaxID=4432 RepID=A0A822Z1Z0_NELNU|nr:TPA_asm: hypothetical protein HUJ06_013119 [Nelumbo nucifera]
MEDSTKQQTSIREVEESLMKKMKESNAKLEQTIAQLRDMFAALANQQLRDRSNHADDHSTDSSFSTRLTKVDFPKFIGENVKGWLYKCDQFFSLDNTSPTVKVKLAAIHLEGKTLQWHHALIKSRLTMEPMNWEDYAKAIADRFGPALDDPMSELMSLKQTGSVMDYMDQFENILTRVDLTEEYKTQMHVRMFLPITVQHAANLAKLFESTQNYKHSKYSHNKNGFSKPSAYGQSQLRPATPSMALPSKQNLVNPSVPLPSKSQNMPILDKPPKVYTAAEMTERRARGLCMFCDEPFTPGHQLKHKKAHLYECSGDEAISPCISVNAITGNSHFQTMRITGYYNKRPLQILIDSGSTHNFVDEQVVKKLGCKVEAIKPMAVSVADGNKVFVIAICKKFSWQIQSTTFTIDCMMSTLGPIVWDFQQQKMEFKVEGKKHALRGATANKLKHADGKQLSKSLLQGGQLALLQLCPPGDNSDMLLNKYASLFDELVELPPYREGFDHRIPMEPEALPVNKRPYRYPSLQKTIIEKLVNEMLDKGIIQASVNPYASPLCIDYRELNSKTVKDKFSIPLLDDLLDELGGASLFTKLDLRSGYHQLCMHKNDVYKTTFKTHDGHYEFLHLELVFQRLHTNSLYIKKSKCSFAASQVEYLSHFISAKGVSIDPSKVVVVRNWPSPTILKQLRGFLGLSRYYRRFVQHYRLIAKPLTDLLKRDQFVWSVEAQQAFYKLKEALCFAPVLALLDFNKPFVIETDASGVGIGAVLMQDHHPIAYISRTLSPLHQRKSVYERELMAILFAIQKWSTYLRNRHFIIKIDQKKNKVADALSRLPNSELLLMALDTIDTDLYSKLQQAWANDPLRRNGKLVVGDFPALKQLFLQWMHDSPLGGHSGRDATLKRLKSLFYWKGMNRDVQQYIRVCQTCQTCKYDASAYPGFLQPLPILATVWSSISMDFIEGLPSFWKDVIFVGVDRLSKATHFMALRHPYTALQVAQVYLNEVFKLHGLLDSIVSDCDPVFLSDFWNELFKFQSVDLLRSSAYYPQTDGQTEVVNRCLNWLPLAEWWYNTIFHSSAQATPYEIVYGQPPPLYLQQREATLKTLKFHLQRAQNRMLQLANKNRSEREFQIGDLVFLKLQPYRQATVAGQPYHKLRPKYYGPYKILDRIGAVAYKFELPVGAQIHNIFHVSQLKCCCVSSPIASDVPLFMVDPTVPKIPKAILDRQLVKCGNVVATKVLVRWRNLPPEEATWEFYYDLCQKYPNFDL